MVVASCSKLVCYNHVVAKKVRIQAVRLKVVAVVAVVQEIHI